MTDLYEELVKETSLDYKYKSELKKLYFEFLQDFKSYLGDYIKESGIDLTISEIEVDTTPQKIAWGEYGGIEVTLKNQGETACYLTTDRKGAYRLDPNEKQKFWLNKETTIVTLSGNTSVGFIRS